METVKRGYMPKDTVEFGPKATSKLNAAAQELAFLLDRGYDTKSASTFVGNHHLLSERQRLALARITSPRAALAERAALTPRETDVLGCLAQGRNTQYMAEHLCISENTVKSHVRNVYQKLGVHSKQDIIDIINADGE